MIELGGLPSLRETAAGLRARRALGQSFLFDENLLAKIARACGDPAGSTVVEIGPGPGGLTRALLRAGAPRLLAVEKDRRCVAALGGLVAAAGGRLRVVEADALSLDLGALVGPDGGRPVVVGNLPFNAATAILMRFVEADRAIARMVFMFQREVARRIAARPRCRGYGRLSVMVQWSCEVEPCCDVPAAAFVPVPKVDATLLRITPRPRPAWPAPRASLRAVATAAFGQRRKTLANALKPLFARPAAALAAAGIAPAARAEEVDLAGFSALARQHAGWEG